MLEQLCRGGGSTVQTRNMQRQPTVQVSRQRASRSGEQQRDDLCLIASCCVVHCSPAWYDHSSPSAVSAIAAQHRSGTGQSECKPSPLQHGAAWPIGIHTSPVNAIHRGANALRAMARSAALQQRAEGCHLTYRAASTSISDQNSAEVRRCSALNGQAYKRTGGATLRATRARAHTHLAM